MAVRVLTARQLERLLEELPDDEPDDLLDGVMDDEDAVPAAVYRALFEKIETLSDAELQQYLDSALLPKARH